ncbi:MAG TPA: VWA domain-containing protein [Blastocatellia bacterium]|jgi:VWFA-related protein|nr:VWA domain-containing protein [Blastocatellia bacterium]
MKLFALMRAAAIVVLLAVLLTASAVPSSIVAAQSGRQPPKKKVEKKTEEQKGNEQPAPSQQEPPEPVPPIPKNINQEPALKLSTQVVNVDVTVIDKKTRRLYTNLTKKNFSVYEDGVAQEITNFTSGEGPMTVVLLLENNFRNRYYTSYFDPTFAQEIFQSAATFVQSFVKPDDHVAIVTYSMKPKVIADFTGDKNRLYQAVMSAYRDTLNFSEANIYDALSFVLLGGKAIQLYDESTGPSEYSGVQEVEGHTAVILVSLGIDTFSRITYDKALKIVSSAGVPIYTVGVGNLFYKKFEHRLPPETRLTFLQAQNSLSSFSKFSGGMYFPMTFETEIPQIMQSIQGMLRSQFSLGYAPTNTRREGKERKIKVDVDVDGDGQPDNKQLELHFRERYVEPDDRPKKK